MSASPFNKRFFVCWILSAIVMYAAFYCWHGLLLTDFSRINFPMPLFLLFSAITYLAISFLLFKIFELKYWELLTSNLYIKSLLSGLALGALLFVITHVLGFSFVSTYSLPHFLVDGAWQVVEQCLGSLTMAIAYNYTFDAVMDRE